MQVCEAATARDIFSETGIARQATDQKYLLDELTAFVQTYAVGASGPDPLTLNVNAKCARTHSAAAYAEFDVRWALFDAAWELGSARPRVQRAPLHDIVRSTSASHCKREAGLAACNAPELEAVLT